MKNPFRRPILGLTLSGGGARGGAHIGVLRVLHEIGYQPDIIVGASIGAFVAALVGAEFSLPNIERIFKQTNLTDMIRPARHGYSLLDSRGYEDTLKAQFGNADLRDLSPRIGVSTTDIRHKQRILLTEGPVVKAILASTAVPGLFAPIEWDDYLLVDGGILDNVPTQKTYEMGADYLVGVDVGSPDGGLDAALGNVRSFSKQLYRALYWLMNLSQRQAAFQIWIESAALSHYAVSQYHLAMFPPDVLIQPHMPRIDLFSMECMDEAIAAGEQATRAAAPQIQSLAQKRFPPRRPNHYSNPINFRPKVQEPS